MTKRKWCLAAVAAVACLELTAGTPPFQQVPLAWRGKIEPMRYGTPGENFLKAGLSTNPLVVDVDGDGDLDLVVSSGGMPRHCFYHYFENPSAKGTRPLHPVFKAPRRVARGGFVSQQLPDGRTAVLGRCDYTFDYPSMKPYRKFKGLPDNVHTNENIRGNVWRFADLNGDGRQDLVVAVGDWKEYGWDNAWDVAGEWTNGPLHGAFYCIRNEATSADEEKWGKPELLRLANGKPIDAFGNPSPLFEDWDGDGDLDLISVDFTDNITFFENIGSKTEPKFASGREIVDKFLKPIKADLCMVTATAADWDGDGRPDLFIDEEDGRVALVRNAGRKNAGTLVFDAPYFLRAERDLLHFGILNTPFAVDIDGDGDQDLVCGNSAGYVAIIENVAGPKAAPKWEEPKVIEIDGAPFRLMAGYNGSIQGPCERKWGYTCLSVADWDGDGLLDIMLNSTRGEIVWSRNVGSRTKPAFAHPEPVEVAWEGPQPELAYGWLKPNGSKNLLTQWRTTPYMIDWNGDGLVDLVMIDTTGTLAFYERAEEKGRRVLLPPKHAFVDENGKPMGFGGWDGKGTGKGGNTGRRKFCFVDWDGDGKLDIVGNSGSVCLYRQLKEEDGKWFFKNEGDLVEERMAGHSTCPTACDFDGDGVPDLVIGAEDGYFYHLANPRTAAFPVLREGPFAK